VRISFLFSLALLAAQVSSANDAVNANSIELLPNDKCVIDNKTAVSCDHLADRLRTIHVRSDAWINLLIDNAKYETVVATLDSLGKNGFTNLDVRPPIDGTNPSGTIKRWIRLRVEGPSNHPFAMVLISTKRFQTWREEMIVLSPVRYEVIDRFTQSRMSQPDCKSFKEFRPGRLFDNMISISVYNEGRIRSCAMPKAESCNFLSELVDIPDVNWTEAEIQPVKHVKGELRCMDPQHIQ
jgi:hypothetical protein